MNLSPYSIVIIVIGIIICTAGWLLFRVSIKIIGFILGASIGYVIAVFGLEFISDSLHQSLDPWIPFLCAILMGFLGIFLIKTVIKLILFIAGLFFGIAVFSIYSSKTMGTIYPFGVEMITRNISLWAIISGFIFGILFIIFEKWFVILYTSAVGAYLIMNQLHVPWVIFYGLIVAGAIIQFFLSKGREIKESAVAKDHEMD